VIVVDAELLTALTIVRPLTPLARQAFLKDPDWAAPPLWRSDFRGGLWKHLSANRISRDQALRAFEMAQTVIAGNEPEPDLNRVLELARAHDLEIYDAEYVAVAMELGVTFVTTDAELARNAGPSVISLNDFLNASP
jgi:predicted nucleic acid-binding protein